MTDERPLAQAAVEEGCLLNGVVVVLATTLVAFAVLRTNRRSR